MIAESRPERNREQSPIAIGALEGTTVRVSPRWRCASRSNSLICHIDVTSLASVVFVLALVYLFGFVEPQISRHGGVPIRTPAVKSSLPIPAAIKEDVLIIGIMRDDSVFFRSEKVSPADLARMIREAVAKGADKKVYIRADIRARWVWVEEVLDATRAAGVEDVAFLVDQRTGAPPQ